MFSGLNVFFISFREKWRFLIVYLSKRKCKVFLLNGGFAKRRCVTFGLDQGFLKKKCIIFGLNGGFPKRNCIFISLNGGFEEKMHDFRLQVRLL